ncbi:MAG: trans-2,3-dihydro-3-hydroxyanthranilate isomerase [Acidobacteriota bacterium]|jgi:trans-2,3-dihydro-3-hydroxyanthranilate isomerase|nr:trans-2,3-dihydro-3-hydroxyanthranilate isomerase [Acidobacteriota bacterium]
MRCRFITADVFTNRPLEGNPLAVFPDARGLSDQLMQRIAREFNLSETVFVLPPDEPQNTRCLRIFTPKAELPFAGHPTVGAAYVLAALGEIPLTGAETRIVFEEGVGPVPVLIRSEEGRPVFTQLTAAKPPEQGPIPPEAAELAEMLSLAPNDVLSQGEAQGGDYPQGFSCGPSFLFIPLRSRDALRRARLRIDVWEEVLLGGWAREVYLFCREPELPGSQIRARMFAAELGIGEDPATGAAVSALGGYLGIRAPESDGTLAWTVEQGFEMGRPSLLHLEVDKQGGEITAVRVGGSSVLVSEGTMAIPGGS